MDNGYGCSTESYIKGRIRWRWRWLQDVPSITMIRIVTQRSKHVIGIDFSALRRLLPNLRVLQLQAPYDLNESFEEQIAIKGVQHCHQCLGEPARGEPFAKLAMRVTPVTWKAKPGRTISDDFIPYLARDGNLWDHDEDWCSSEGEKEVKQKSALLPNMLRRCTKSRKHVRLPGRRLAVRLLKRGTS